MSLETQHKQRSAMDLLKKIKRIIGLIALLVTGFAGSPNAVAQPGYSVPVESFYNELAPYGQWVQHPGYGSVWLPNVGPEFQPYASAGHWVVTEYGNTWVSDYPWGWAPFHYGRWIFDQAFGGWLWIPGSDWGPAWVSWRSGGGYYGWAPLGPGVNVNVNINIPAPYWTFVPQVYITSPNLYSYYVPRPRVVNIYQSTTIINNYYRTNNRSYVYGPPRNDIERITRQNVPVYRIDPMDRPGRSVVGNGSVGFYRPGQSAGYRQDYGRNDRYNNAPRPDYNGNSAPSRGYYNNGNNGVAPNRDYNGNGSPNRDYNGSGSSRSYDRNFSNDRNGNAGVNPAPAPGNYAAPQPSRVEPNRGNYSPGNSPQSTNGQQSGQAGGYSPGNFQRSGAAGAIQQPQSNRSFERVDRQPQLNSNSQPASGGGFQRVQESRSQAAPQAAPQQPQRSMGNTNSGLGERHQRGPR